VQPLLNPDSLFWEHNPVDFLASPSLNPDDRVSRRSEDFFILYIYFSQFKKNSGLKNLQK
jgi:hypothetical protein